MGFRIDDFIKTKQEIEDMRVAGKYLSEVLTELKSMIKPGLDVIDLENHFISYCKAKNLIPACKGYDPFGSYPFPTGLCVSINSQAVHCFPKKGITLKSGDIVTVDTVIKYKNIHVDSAFAHIVGKARHQAQKFLETVKKALENSINEVSDGVKIGKISSTLQKTVEKAGFNVLRDYAGHGIGHEMHEWPQILCYGNKNDGPKLKSGMTICIESLCCTGSPKVENLNLWETKMRDSGLFSQFEHTILVLDDGYEILTG